MKAVLFTKEGCPPCELTKEFIAEHVKAPFDEHLVVMKKENHSALVAAYELDLFPTLIVTGREGEPTLKVVGGKNIRAQINYILEGIHEASV